MVVTGNQQPDTGLSKEREQRRTPGQRDVEVLIRLVGLREKPWVMLEDNDVARAAGLGLGKLGAEPRLLRRGFVLCLIRRVNQCGIEDDAGEVPVLKGIAIRTKASTVRGDRCRRGRVLDVVVTRHLVDRNRRQDSPDDALVLGNLASIPSLV